MMTTGNLLACGGLGIYIIILAYQLTEIISLWQMREFLTIITYLALIALAINAGFFVWTCLVIYQLLFDLQPHTYSQALNLLIFCWIEIIIECLKIKFLK